MNICCIYWISIGVKNLPYCFQCRVDFESKGMHIKFKIAFLATAFSTGAGPGPPEAARLAAG